MKKLVQGSFCSMVISSIVSHSKSDRSPTWVTDSLVLVYDDLVVTENMDSSSSKLWLDCIISP